MNIVHLLGRVGQEPELRTMQSGKVMATFSLATSRKYRDSNGERQEKTTWHRCICFQEGLAKVIGDYVHKGDMIQASGSIDTRSYEKDGEKRTAFEIVVSDINFVPSGKSSGEERRYVGDTSGQYDVRKSQAPSDRPAMDQGQGFGRDAMSDEVPFAPEVR